MLDALIWLHTIGDSLNPVLGWILVIILIRTSLFLFVRSLTTKDLKGCMTLTVLNLVVGYVWVCITHSLLGF